MIGRNHDRFSSDEERMAFEEWLIEQVDAAPPLTEQQLDELVPLFTERRQAAKLLAWHEQHRLQIDSEALSLLRQQGDDSVVRLIDQCRAEAIEIVRNRERPDTN
jgi:hypothetical protein